MSDTTSEILIRFASDELPRVQIECSEARSRDIARWIGCHWRHYDTDDSLVDLVTPEHTAPASPDAAPFTPPPARSRAEARPRTRRPAFPRVLPAMRLWGKSPSRLVFTYPGLLLLALAVAVIGYYLAGSIGSPSLPMSVFLVIMAVAVIVTLHGYFTQWLHLVIDKASGTLTYSTWKPWGRKHVVVPISNIKAVELRYHSTRFSRQPCVFLAFDDNSLPPLRLKGRRGPHQFSLELAAWLGCEWRWYYLDGRIRETRQPGEGD